MKTLLERNLMGIWLMSCTVLLAAFAGLLRNQMIKQQTIRWIDSWDDLTEWKHMNIQTTTTGYLVSFIDNHPNHIYSKEFVPRLEKIEYVDIETGIAAFDFDRVISGKLAIASNADYLEIFKKNLLVDGLVEDVNFHISSLGGVSQPYFIQLHKTRLNSSLIKIFNLVSVKFVLIYEYKFNYFYP